MESAAGMTFSHLLAELANRRAEVHWDGQNVRIRPGSVLDEAMIAAIGEYRPRLVWMLRRRLPPIAGVRPAWEFWFRPEDWIEFLKVREIGV